MATRIAGRSVAGRKRNIRALRQTNLLIERARQKRLAVRTSAADPPAIRTEDHMRRPLSVVGSDQEALKALLSLHACPEPRILDVTHNQGRMWSGLPYKPHRSDRDPDLHARGFTDTIADFRALPFEDGSFDVIVFDPPHITEGGRHGLVGERGSDWAERYGTWAPDLGGENISGLFDPFLAEAKRVLIRGGVVLAKVADQIHRGSYQWQHVDMVVAAREAGFTACDMMLTVHWSRGGLVDPRWLHVNHARQVHCYWLVLRNGAECISQTAPLADLKTRTGELFASLEIA